MPLHILGREQVHGYQVPRALFCFLRRSVQPAVVVFPDVFGAEPVQDIARILLVFPGLLEKLVQLLHWSLSVYLFGALRGGVLEHVIFALVYGFAVGVFDALRGGLLRHVFCALGALVFHGGGGCRE